jgi:ferredoxin
MTTIVSRKIVLHFSRQTWDQPLVYHLAKDFDLTFNILKAEINPNAEGMVLLELSGPESQYKKGVKFLKERGVQVESLSQDVTRDESKCTSCGACLAVCPTEALEVDRTTWLVRFDPQKCIGCEACIPACPPRAMEIGF